MLRREKQTKKDKRTLAGCGSAFTCFIYALFRRLTYTLTCTAYHMQFYNFLRAIRIYSPCTCAESRMRLYTTVMFFSSSFFSFHLLNIQFFFVFCICGSFPIFFCLLFRAGNTMPRAYLWRCIERVA